MRPAGDEAHRTWVTACIVDAARRSNRAIDDVSRSEFIAMRPSGGIDWPCARDFSRHGGWAALRSDASGTGPGVPLSPIPAGHTVKGVSTLVDADGATVQQWVKTRVEAESGEALLARLLSELPTKVPAREGCIEGPKQQAPSDDLLACYCVGDPHIGLFAWAPESGANFDLKIAEDLLVAATRDLVLRGPRTRKALICQLGDLLHADNVHGYTTNSTHALDVDGRMAKVLAVAMRIVTTMIDAALEHHAEVEVDSQIGNHDAHTSIIFAIGLAAYYRNEPRVTIPVNPATRHYHRFGKVLIGTTHGDRTKADDLGSIMASEVPRDWGETKFRTFLCGHVHHSTLKEYRGMTVETFRTLAARDSWHAGQGYVSGRDMVRICFHRNYGEVGREIAGLDYLLRNEAA